MDSEVPRTPGDENKAVMESLPINDLIQMRITRQLYQHAPAAIFATIVNCIIVAIVFRNTLNPRINLGWAGSCIIFLLFRFVFTRTVLKNKMTLENYRRRLWQFGITICISGILFGSSGVLFLSLERPAYNAFIFFLMGGVFAGSLGAFAIDRKVFAAFSIPIILPVTVHSFILGGEINTAMAVMGILFTVMMILVVSRMNQTMVAAFRLDIQNTQLAHDTQRLNNDLMVVNEKFRLLSFYDSLTNATNRRFISDILQPEVDRFAYTRKNNLSPKVAELAPEEFVYGVYIIDIDHFKQVNDMWGHKCGDRLLIQFVEILKSLVRKDDVVSRWGGEEFVIVLKRTTPDYLQVFAGKVIHTVASTKFQISETHSIQKTCSLGYAHFPFIRHEPAALSLEQTIEIADKALYHAKTNGRNQAVRAEVVPLSGEGSAPEMGSLLIQHPTDTIEKFNIKLCRVDGSKLKNEP